MRSIDFGGIPVCAWRLWWQLKPGKSNFLVMSKRKQFTWSCKTTAASLFLAAGEGNHGNSLVLIIPCLRSVVKQAKPANRPPLALKAQHQPQHHMYRTPPPPPPQLRTDRQTDRQVTSFYTDRQTDRQTNTPTQWHPHTNTHPHTHSLTPLFDLSPLYLYYSLGLSPPSLALSFIRSLSFQLPAIMYIVQTCKQKLLW